jgi:hypothetical protein
MQLARRVLDSLMYVSESYYLEDDKYEIIKSQLKALEKQYDIKLKVTKYDRSSGVNVYITKAPFYFQIFDKYNQIFMGDDRDDTYTNIQSVAFARPDANRVVVYKTRKGKELDKEDTFSTDQYDLRGQPIVKKIYDIANQFNYSDKNYDPTRDDHSGKRYIANIYQGDTTKPFIYTGKEPLINTFELAKAEYDAKYRKKRQNTEWDDFINKQHKKNKKTAMKIEAEVSDVVKLIAKQMKSGATLDKAVQTVKSLPDHWLGDIPMKEVVRRVKNNEIK